MKGTDSDILPVYCPYTIVIAFNSQKYILYSMFTMCLPELLKARLYLMDGSV